MEIRYEIKGDILKTNDFEVCFPHCIDTVILFDDIFIVLLSPTDENGKIITNLKNNIYGVNADGKILWQIGSLSSPDTVFDSNNVGDTSFEPELFTGIHLWPDGVKATSFFALRYTLDHKTGKILKKDSVRW